MALKKVYLTSDGCRLGTYEVNGKHIRITHDKPYITADIKEQLFFARQRNVGVVDADAKELKHHLYNIANLPSIVKDVIAGSNIAEISTYRARIETELRKVLSDAGIKLVPDDIEERDKINGGYIHDDTEAMITKLKSKGYTVFKRPTKDDGTSKLSAKKVVKKKVTRGKK